MKRKISIIKAFAILLSICLLISSNLTVIEVFASEVNVSSTDDEATKEAKEDYNSPKLKAGNWKKAHFEDGLPWNYFHNTVQRDVRANHSDFENTELSVTKQNGKPGRVDIWNYIADRTDEDYQTAYYWEVKPGSYLRPDKMVAAILQLNQYILGTPNSSYTILEKKVGGDLGKSVLSFNKLATLLGANIRLKNDIELFLCFDDTGRYAILYAYMGNGIILYWFAKADIDNGKPTFNPNAFRQIFSAAFWAALYKYSQNMNTGQNSSDPSPVPADAIPAELQALALQNTKELLGYERISDYVKYTQEEIQSEIIENTGEKLLQFGKDSYLLPKSDADHILNLAIKIAALGLTTKWLTKKVDQHTSTGKAKDFLTDASLIAESILNNPTTCVYAGTTYVVVSSENYAIIQEFAELLDDFKVLHLNVFDDVFDYDKGLTRG